MTPIKARVAVMYFMVKSCIHTVRRPELHQNMPYLFYYENRTQGTLKTIKKNKEQSTTG